MRCQRSFVLILMAFLLGVYAFADSQPTKTKPEKMTKETRMNLIRAFEAETVFVRRPFPMGPEGLTLKDGQVHPDDSEIQRLIATYGPALKPGDRARITNIDIKDDRIIFEINDGPKKKRKWYQHIEVGMGGTMAPIDPSDPNANPRGTYVVLEFDKYIPEMQPEQVKELLNPVLDFHAKSAVEAYLDTLPAAVKEAIKDHEVLVGMNHDMVTYAKGRPPQKIREKDNGVPYEEWIYGAPPQDVEFVRFVGDQVVRLETMSVDGKKTVNTERAAAFDSPEYAKQQGKPPGAEAGADSASANKPAEAKRSKAPTLRRPGEAPTDTLPPMTTPDSGDKPHEWGMPGSDGPNQTNAPNQTNPPDAQQSAPSR